MEGVEPPTPAFSGLYSTEANSLITKVGRLRFEPKIGSRIAAKTQTELQTCETLRVRLTNSAPSQKHNHCVRLISIL